MFLSGLCSGEWNVQWRGKAAAGQRAASSSLKSSETGLTWKSFVCCAVLYFFFLLLVLWLSLIQKFWGCTSAYIYTHTLHADWTTPHPLGRRGGENYKCGTVTTDFVCLAALVAEKHNMSQLNGFKATRFISPMDLHCGQAHQGSLFRLCPLSLRAGAGIISWPTLAWHLVWEDQKSWRQVGAAGPLFSVASL